MALLSMLIAPLGHRAIERLGAHHAITADSVSIGLGATLLAFSLAVKGAGIAPGWIAVCLGFNGAGSVVIPAILAATLSRVRPDQAGAASGMINTIQQLAGVVGLTGVGAIFFAVLGSDPAPAYTPPRHRWLSGSRSVSFLRCRRSAHSRHGVRSSRPRADEPSWCLCEPWTSLAVPGTM
jgi:lysophospholipase L1-like esterase